MIIMKIIIMKKVIRTNIFKTKIIYIEKNKFEIYIYKFKLINIS